MPLDFTVTDMKHKLTVKFVRATLRACTQSSAKGTAALLKTSGKCTRSSA